MREGWRRARLGEAARLDIDRVLVRPCDTYSIAGVWNAGQGLFARSEIRGSETTYPTLHRLHTGQLVMRKLTAWEGTITTVSPEFDGYVVSPEFPTYTLAAELDPGFMRLVCQRKDFWEGLRDASTGTVQRRKRVNPHRLLEIEIDLPPLAEQRRIVDLVDHVQHVGDRAEAQAGCARHLGDAIRATWFTDRLLSSRPLRSVVEITNGRLRNPLNAVGPYMTRYVRTANVQDGHLQLDEPMYMNFKPSEQARYALRSGDVLVTEGSGSRASIGASCRWDGEISGMVCFQNHLLRLRPLAGSLLSPEFVYEWALWSHRTGRFAEIATGTNILSLGVEHVAGMAMPLDEPEAMEAFVGNMLAIEEAERAARDVAASAASFRSTLVSALLSGGHEIPASYDRFLDGAA